jgi:hypothetical protein
MILLFVLNTLQLGNHAPHITNYTSPLAGRIFLPIRLGGCGFTSSKMTRKAAYIGSIALAAKMIGTLSPNLKNNASTSPWSSYLQFLQSFNEAKTNPHLRLQEDFHLSDIWESSAPKLQAIVSRAENARRRLELWKTVPSGRPRAGMAIAAAFSVEQLAMRQQALANEDPSASAWLTASPAWPENRMNDVAFRTAFQLRNLIPYSAYNKKLRIEAN